MNEEKNKSLVDVVMEIIIRCHETYINGGPVALDELLRNNEPNSSSTYRFKSELTEWDKLLDMSIGESVQHGDDMKSFRGLCK